MKIQKNHVSKIEFNNSLQFAKKAGFKVIHNNPILNGLSVLLEK
jgi:hypothetical protein